MKTIFLLSLISTSVFGQIKNIGPEPLIKGVYIGYDNPIEFTSDPYFPSFRTVCSNCTIFLRDSLWYLRPGTTGVSCTLNIYESKRPRLLGIYVLPFSRLPEPRLILGNVENGGTLTGLEQVLSFGYDTALNLKGLNFKILSYQLFIEGYVPSWVFPGNQLEIKELEQLKLKINDGYKTKVRIVLQVKDEKGVISNRGGFFYV